MSKITQQELEFAADAIRQIAVSKGFGFYFTDDNYRDIARKVITAFLAVREGEERNKE